ncbi:Phosphopantetheine attachment site [Lentzea fradiae]|uniref:Phosphopantetheine attachment site n=1 Tax=Lentzea fradiae TaxID=200378 RepID=A0A1G8CU20_9PSEU|nr:phosphopantetheine-binding protein [Lentzea fradiae]SDH48938.1 Phosphopantetheine attachment site [Lentzea fradiae]
MSTTDTTAAGTRQWREPPEAVAQMLLAAQLAPVSSYTIDVRAELVGVSADAVRRAAAELVVRYPELGAEVDTTDDGGFRWRPGPATPWLPTSATTGDGPADRVFDQLAATADEAPGTPLFQLVLSGGPPTRVLVRAHHAIADGPGLAALVTELAELATADAAVPQRRTSAFAAPPHPAPAAAAREDWEGQLALLEATGPAVDRAGDDDRPAVTARATLDREVLGELARAARATPTAVLLAATRVAVARRFGWSLQRLTVPLAAEGDRLLAIRPLPVPHPLPVSGSVRSAIDSSADALFDALDRGAPPADLVGRLSSSVVPGVPDCLLTVNTAAGVAPEHPAVRVHPGPHRGAPGLLAVELTGDDLRLSGHPAHFTADDLAGFAEELAAVLAAPDAPAIPDGRSLTPVPATSATPGARRAATEATSDDLERCLAVWRGAFGDQVGPDDDLFALGANSFTCARVAARLRAATARPVTIRVLYRHPTARALAAWVATTPPQDR